MPHLNQTGFAHILVMILLMIGLVVGVYLVGRQTNIFPKAADFKQSVSGPIPVCQKGLNSFNLEQPCPGSDLYKQASYTCFGGKSGVVGNNTCQRPAQLQLLAKQACAGQSNCPPPTPIPTPSPAPTSTPNPTPTPQAAKRVFITGFSVNFIRGMSFKGLSGADALCQVTANGKNLGGSWKAWLSDSSVSAASRLTHNTDSYKLLDGTVIANNWNDLTDGSLLHSINITESGTGISSAAVWTNTRADGSISNVNSNCGDWSLNPPPGGLFNATGDSGMAFSDVYKPSNFENKWWTEFTSASCSTNHPLYCFEQ